MMRTYAPCFGVRIDAINYVIEGQMQNNSLLAIHLRTHEGVGRIATILRYIMSDTTASTSHLELRSDVSHSQAFDSEPYRRHSIVNDGTRYPSKPLISTKGWTLAQLIKKSPNFCLVDRVRFDDPMLMQTIRIHENSGAPLIIEGFHEHDSWPTDLFTLDWLSVHGKPGKALFLMIECVPLD
jgi:hypothetical protein